MNRVPWGRTIATALVLVATAKGARASAPGEIWSGTSAGFDVHWSRGEIEVRRGDRQVFSAREWAKAGLDHFVTTSRSDGQNQPPDCDYRHTIRIIAIVGAMMSIEDRVEFSCRKEAHPGGLTRLLTVDLTSTGSLAQAGPDSIGSVDVRQPGRAVLLTQLFPAADVRSAIADAPPLRDVIARTGAGPAMLPALLDAIADASGEGESCFIVPRDLLASFSFYRLDNQRIVVRLGLPGDGPCRMNLTTADLQFAVPGSIAPAAQKAATGDEGFFADRGEAIRAGRVTTIDLHSGRGLKH